MRDVKEIYCHAHKWQIYPEFEYDFLENKVGWHQATNSNRKIQSVLGVMHS